MVTHNIKCTSFPIPAFFRLPNQKVRSSVRGLIRAKSQTTITNYSYNERVVKGKRFSSGGMLETLMPLTSFYNLLLDHVSLYARSSYATASPWPFLARFVFSTIAPEERPSSRSCTANIPMPREAAVPSIPAHLFNAPAIEQSKADNLVRVEHRLTGDVDIRYPA